MNVAHLFLGLLFEELAVLLNVLVEEKGTAITKWEFLVTRNRDRFQEGKFRAEQGFYPCSGGIHGMKEVEELGTPWSLRWTYNQNKSSRWKYKYYLMISQSRKIICPTFVRALYNILEILILLIQLFIIFFTVWILFPGDWLKYFGTYK